MMTPTDTRATAVGRAAGFLTKPAAALGAWRAARATRIELNRLSDRELDDIGVARSDIERIARGA